MNDTAGGALSDLLTKKIPPHSLPAERAVLGAVLLERATLPLVSELLVASDFFKESHRLIFEAARAVAASGQVPDLLTVQERLKLTGVLEEAGGSAALAELAEEGALQVNHESYVTIIRDHAIKRDLIRLSTNIISAAYNGNLAPELLQTAAEQIARLTGPAQAPQPFAEGAGTFLTREFAPVEVLIENILTGEGPGWIGGEEKLGKSFYALAEGIALATGTPLCRRFRVPVRRRVLFIEEEDSPRRLHGRMRALLRGLGFDLSDADVRADLHEWLRVAVWTGFCLDSKEWMARLDAELAAFPATVVYLDVLRKLTAKDLNKADQAGELLDGLDHLRRTRGCLFRVLHHFRKGQGPRMGRGSQELGGSFVLSAWAEQSIFLEPIGRKGAGVTFDVQAKDAAAGPTLRLRLESEGPQHEPVCVRLYLEDHKPEQAAGERYADQVEALLSTLPAEPSPHGAGVTVKALAAALKKSDKTVRRTLAFLIESGRCAANSSPSNKLRRYFCAAPEKHENAAQADSERLFQ